MIQSFAKGGQKYLQLKRGAEASGNEKGKSMKEPQWSRAYRFGVQVLAVLVVVYILQVLEVLYVLQVMAVLYLFIYFIVDDQ